MNEEEIRLRLEMILQGGQAVEAQLRSVLTIEQALVEINQRQRQAADARAQAARAAGEARDREAQREKGLIEGLIAEERRLTEARNQSRSTREVQAYNRELVRVQQQLRTLQGVTASATSGMAGSFRNLRGFLVQALSVYEIARFGKALLDAGDNAQSFAITLNTLLKSKEKADQVAADAVRLAAKTPFTLKDVQDQIRGLAAYGVEAENLIPTITSLGNISAAVGTDRLPLLVLAYGQVRTANKLTGQELRQFSESGVNLLDMLARQSGKSLAQVRKDISAGAVGFRDVEKAIAAATGKGGQFYNLMEQRSTTIGGKVSNFLDGMYQGYVRIEKQVDESAKAAVDWGTRTVQALTGSDSALGRTAAYVKAAAGAWATYLVWQNRAAIQARANAIAQAYNNAITLTGTGVVNGLRAATSALWVTLRANPLGVVLTLVGAAYTAYQAWRGVTADVTSALGEQEAKLRSEQELLRARVGAVLATNQNDRIRLGLIAQLRKEYPELLKGLDDEQVKNSVLVKALTAVNRQYRDKINLARIAYNVEKNDETQRSLLDREREAVEQLKKDFPAVKIATQDLAEAIEAIQRSGVKTVESYVTGLDGTTQTLDKLALYKKRLADLQADQKALDEAVTQTTLDQVEAEQKQAVERERNYKRDVRRREDLRRELKTVSEERFADVKQDLVLVEARIKAYEEEHQAKTEQGTDLDTKQKQWHNAALQRRLNEAMALEDGLAKKIAVSRAEEKIAVDRARFEKKSEQELTTIRLEYAEKRRKLIEDDKADALKRIAEVEEAFAKLKDALADSQKKELEGLAKLDAEFAEISLKRQRENARTELDEIALLSGQIMRLTFGMEEKRRAGTLTVSEEKRVRNEVAKLLLDVDALRAKYNDREAVRVRKAEEEKRRNYRETLQVVVTALNGFESASIRSLGVIVTALVQLREANDALKDAQATGQGIAEAQQAVLQSKIALGLQTAGALSQAFFQAESERYARLTRESSERYQAEREAMEARNEAELSGFRGSAQQRALIEARQKKDAAALEARYQREQADLKTKQFNAERAGKVAQTIMAGALAAVQSFATMGPAGPIIAGALTAAQVALIVSQKTPRFYFRGTEFVDREGLFPAGRDTVPAMLTRGERVLPAEDNKRLRGMANADLVQNALLGHRLRPLPVGLHRFVLEGVKPTAQQSARDPELNALVRELIGKVEGQKQTRLTIDKNGFTVSERTRAAEVQQLKNQYFG